MQQSTIVPISRNGKKLNQAQSLNITHTEYDTPYRQPLSTMGWEDGIYISRDGNNLYCIYAPGDLLSWTLNSADPDGI